MLPLVISFGSNKKIRSFKGLKKSKSYKKVKNKDALIRQLSVNTKVKTILVFQNSESKESLTTFKDYQEWTKIWQNQRDSRVFKTNKTKLPP